MRYADQDICAFIGLIAIQDLMNWSDVYVAGRLHKPVKIIRHDDEIQSMLQFNL